MTAVMALIVTALIVVPAARVVYNVIEPTGHP